MSEKISDFMFAQRMCMKRALLFQVVIKVIIFAEVGVVERKKMTKQVKLSDARMQIANFT